MRFRVQGHNYFLHFDRDEGRWFVFEPTLRGIRRTAVIDDAQFGDFRFVIAANEEQEQVVN